VRRKVFRYALSVDWIAPSMRASGHTRDIGASDLIISLGALCPVSAPCPGTETEQAGTLMHELGHALGLRHGGQDDIGRKPNHLSPS
jgi:hypothetical protein